MSNIKDILKVAEVIKDCKCDGICAVLYGLFKSDDDWKCQDNEKLADKLTFMINEEVKGEKEFKKVPEELKKYYKLEFRFEKGFYGEDSYGEFLGVVCKECGREIGEEHSFYCPVGDLEKIYNKIKKESVEKWKQLIS